jgi:hypothetical protein
MCAANAVAPNLCRRRQSSVGTCVIKACVPVKVPPPPSLRSAMPPCRLPKTVAVSSFSRLRPAKKIGEGRYGESTVYDVKLFTAIGVFKPIAIVCKMIIDSLFRSHDAPSFLVINRL